MRHTIITAVVALMAFVTAQAQTAIEIVYSGASASVSIPTGVAGVTAAVNGANVTILSTTTTNEYVYRVRGQSPDGSLLISGSYKLQLQLAGLNLTNAHGGAAIDVECGKRIAVELMAGTQNSLADAAGTQKGAFYFKGHAEFEGSGTLSVTGRAKHAICAKEYIELKSSTGTINVLGAVSDGIHCGKGKVNDDNNYFLMKGGVVNIMNVAGDGIDSDDYGVLTIEGGALSVNVGAGATALKADSTVTIRGGLINLSVEGDDSEAIRARYAVSIAGGTTTIAVKGDGSKGIKAKRYEVSDATATVRNGGFLTIGGGTTTIDVQGGNLTNPDTGDTDKCMAASVDADMQMTDGTLSLTAMGPEARTLNVKGSQTLSGGQLEEMRSPWAVDTRDYRYDMTAYVDVSLDGMPLADYSRVAVGAFVGNRCVGFARFSTADYGTLRIRSNESTAQTVGFCLYDYETGITHALKPSQEVVFTPDGCVGQPGAPLRLVYTIPQKGDVNGDRLLNVTDVTTLINYILGKQPAAFDVRLADLNGDGLINVTDVTQVINAILGK